ncbi:MAG: glutamine synthetase family protein [bacterium]|nr:glutamine synthetase [Gammaproteobacteria bacterium]HIL96881.1 glutamine synthetase [Pseudomonadales bacterium]
MNKQELPDWLDRHHVSIIRTHATSLDGPGLGKYLHRNKFFNSLPKGHAVSDMALTMDVNGTPHMTLWHPQREANLGDIFLKPDLNTLISDGADPNLGHCIVDFTNDQGVPMDLCPRSTLKKMVARVAALGYEIKATYELEFFVYKESYQEIRASQFRRMTPLTTSTKGGIYNLRNAYHVKPLMDEVIKRMEWQGIQWEGWNDEAGVGQIELNLVPCDPVTAADNVVRTKQILFEVAVDLGLSVTFMAKPGSGYSSGMHIHHSLLDTDSGEPAFFDEQADQHRSQLMTQWVAGLVATMPGAVSYLCPTVNSFRRFTDYAAVPMTASWGEENKSTALRLISRAKNIARIEHRVGASDLNPYLALAVILAGGIAGVTHSLTPTEEFNKLAWGLPASPSDLPMSISQAAKCLKDDELLAEVLGASNTNYWAKTRQAEWLVFHTEGADATSHKVSQWEYDRYFEMI